MREAREIVGLDQNEFGRALGISSRDTISRWERNLNFPPADILQRMNEKFGININWLITGNGSMKGDDELAADYLRIPLLGGAVKADPEGSIVSDEAADWYPFKRDWVEKKFGHSEYRHRALVLIRIHGDSMTPTIGPGELALIDQWDEGRMNIKNCRIYLVRLPDQESITIRRLILNRMDDKVCIICVSDNTTYEPFEIEVAAGKTIDYYVLGRVRWAGREFD